MSAPFSNRKVLGKTYVHSSRFVNGHGDEIIGVAENCYFDNGDVEPNLVFLKNPKRTVYITKPQFRTHTEKKEIEHISKLDSFVVENRHALIEAYKALNGHYPKGYVSPKSVMDSPYVYGMSTEIEALIKMKYKNDFLKTGLAPAKPTTGFLDMEWDIGSGVISIITYTHENKLYTAINRGFFYEKLPDGTLVPGDIEKVKQLSDETIKKLIDEVVMSNKKNKKLILPHLPFTTEYYVGEDDLDMLKWTMGKVHENKTNYVGIWNIEADIPKILERLKFYGVAPEDVFSHPDVPPIYRFTRFKEDQKPCHYTDKWHWFYCIGYTQFIDAMCLYVKLRTVSGKENSPALDAILKKNDLEGKLYFPELEDTVGLSKTKWHIHMVKHHFYHYIIYAQADVFLLQMMEWKNGDLPGMSVLSDVTPLHKFPRQSKGVENVLYADWKPRGYIIASVGSSMVGPYDEEIGAVGGAVLSPARMDNNGVAIFLEYPDHKTQVHMGVNDLDFTGQYPNTDQAANIAKETKLSTALYIYGDNVQKYYSPRRAVEITYGYIINPKDNAIRIGTELFSLPDFETMEMKVRRKLGLL